MQIAVIEYARHQAGFASAHSREFSEDSEHYVIDLMPDQQGNLPQGRYHASGPLSPASSKGTKMKEAYGKAEIGERHRHRYEFNNVYRDQMEAAGLTIAAHSDGRLVEAIELSIIPSL